MTWLLQVACAAVICAVSAWFWLSMRRARARLRALPHPTPFAPVEISSDMQRTRLKVVGLGTT